MYVTIREQMRRDESKAEIMYESKNTARIEEGIEKGKHLQIHFTCISLLSRQYCIVSHNMVLCSKLSVLFNAITNWYELITIGDMTCAILSSV